MIIAFPPCTDLAVSGARWFERKRKDGSQRTSIEFFCKFLEADCDKICIENPVGIIAGDYIPKWYPDLAERYGLPIKPTQTIQPYEFGHPTKKTTCLWLKGLKPLKPTNIVEPVIDEYVCKSGKIARFGHGIGQAISEDGKKKYAFDDPMTARLRSKTFEGVAKAMADQWGGKKGGGYIQLEINKPIRLIELFSGIGFQRMALRDIGADFESWRTCEWDVNAIRQYKAIHCSDNNQDYSYGKTKEQLADTLLQAGISNDGKKPMSKEKLANKSEKWLREVYNDCCATLNLVDISKVTGDSLQIEDTDKYCYILTYSFPCQSLSIAGAQEGMEEASGTSSSLLWEVKRILSECTELPQILLMENVTQVHSKKNLPQFEAWIKFLESLGYSNFWQDMNAKDYGTPQSRNRTFMISILDLTNQTTFEFPKPINLNKEFVDVLVDEDTVEERFYIDSPRARELVQKLVDNGELVTEQRERESNSRFISQQSETKENCKLHNRTSCTGWELDREATSQKQWGCQFCKKKRDIHFVGNISPINKRQNPNQGRVYMVDGISPTLTGMEGGGRQPHIIVRSAI